MPPKTLREETLGKIRLRLVRRENGALAGLYLRPGQKGKTIDGRPDESHDELWQRIVNAAYREDPSFLGYDGAIARFRSFFPGGFEDPEYLEKERKDKDRARELLNQSIPIEEAAQGVGFVDGVIAVYKETKLVHPKWERPKIIEALQSDDGRGLVQHLASFALGDWTRLSAISAICDKYRAGIWPIVTYLPFLWDSGKEHALLRRKPTYNFATRVGHPFCDIYESRLFPPVYQSLLDLFAITREKIANLQPRDRIDVQSFVWVVSEYKDEE